MMNGLYVLLSETNVVMSRKVLDDPEETTALLMKMEIEGTSGNTLVAAFGQWYLYPPANGGIERTNKILEIVKQSLNAWTSGGGGENTMNHFTEMRCLRDYLQYLRLKKQYKELKEGALETLNKEKEDYVLQELHKYEQHIKATEERSKWGWSPLYLLLKQHPLPSGPQCPWVHTKELQDIITELEKESEPFSLENECPHVGNSNCFADPHLGDFILWLIHTMV
ncbi:hypothetical protein CY35_07G030600 [Sphagnum magellanicum]|uniref:Uncharacterized protein n=1 Tax=Sphagnum magellanicum TaxID=128215 RepID=A0ACB8HL62_9BRYO|nr:hypothetical protein CY35_07G030600 [Sphagnum magellanicum]